VLTQTLPSALAAEISDSETVFAGADFASFAVPVGYFVPSVFSTGLVVFVSVAAALLVASLADFFARLVTVLVASSSWAARKGGITTRPISAITVDATLLNFLIVDDIIAPWIERQRIQNSRIQKSEWPVGAF
jgi:hypothetical protein